MENNRKPEKALCLRKQAAAIMIEKAINQSAVENALSFSDLEDILFRYFTEVQRGAELERREANAIYSRQMALYQQKKEEEMKDERDHHCESDT